MLSASILLFAGAAESAEAPRVVSFNLCSDQLVLALADPGQIAGLSPYAADPGLSIVAEEARQFRRLDWQAEATLALAPELVVVGPNDRSVTRRMLTAQGLKVVEAELVSDIEAAKRQIRQFAALLGHPERGEKLIAKLDAARARLAAVRLPDAQTALVVERGGYMQGPQSLVAALLAEAGLKAPAGAPSGYGGFIPLEKFLTLRPDIVFVKDPPRAPQDQGALYITHPALAALYPPDRRIALPTRYTMCGGPALVAAFDYLADTLGRISHKP
ncbi:MAG: ABC transporter substrate-binding protein [Pseudorhodoplanes sp.]|nr:ABC transporter substrate-binding protein [Pseudorhodoplanes sp.]